MSAQIFYNNGSSSSEVITHLINSTDGTGLHFDGAAGYVDTSSPAALGTKFSAEFIIQADAWGDSGDNQAILDIDGSSRFVIASDSSISNNLGIYTASSYVSFGSKVLDDLKVHHLVITVDGDSCICYDNGNQIGTLTSTSSSDISAPTQARLGHAYSSGMYFEGTIYRARLWNKTLSQAEVTASYENATVPFADQYGSQTSLVDAAASVFTSGTYNWTAYGSNTIANVSNTLAITYTGGSPSTGGAYNFLKNSSDLTTDLTIGKKYRLTVDAKYAGGAAGVRLNVNNGVTAYYSAALTTSSVNYTFEFTAQSAAGAYIQIDLMAVSNVVTIDNWYVREIGVVSDYDLSYANQKQSLVVEDRSGSITTGANATGMMSATGVVQVTPIEQLNSKSARIGTTAATPADGDLLVSGKVGIGTGDPQALADLLEIYPDSGSAVEGLQLLIRGGQADLNPAGDSIGIGFGYGNANDYIKSGIISEFTSTTAVSNLHLCTTATAGAATVTKSDARLTIDSAGNAGFQTTPKAWNSIMPAIQVGSAASLVGRTANNQCRLGNNWYYDAVGDKRINAGYASQYIQTDSGEHEFFTATTSTADSAITFGPAKLQIANSGLATFANDVKVGADANYVLEGYATGRNVLRSIIIKIENATDAGKIKCSGTGLFNASDIAVEDNLARGVTGTRFYYSEGSNDDMVWVLVAGLDGNCVGVLSGEISRNYSGTDLTLYTAQVSPGAGLNLRFANATTGALVDLDTLVDTGYIEVRVAYLTSS